MCVVEFWPQLVLRKHNPKKGRPFFFKRFDCFDPFLHVFSQAGEFREEGGGCLLAGRHSKTPRSTPWGAGHMADSAVQRCRAILVPKVPEARKAIFWTRFGPRPGQSGGGTTGTPRPPRTLGLVKLSLPLGSDLPGAILGSSFADIFARKEQTQRRRSVFGSLPGFCSWKCANPYVVLSFF